MAGSKTVNEFVEEVKNDAELRKAAGTAAQNGTLSAFLEQHEVEATADEFLKACNPELEEREITDNEAEIVMGGKIEWGRLSLYRRDAEVVFNFCVGDEVETYCVFGTERGRIIEAAIFHDHPCADFHCAYSVYKVRLFKNNEEDWYTEELLSH